MHVNPINTKNSFQEPSSRNDLFSSIFQLAQAPLLRGDPIFGVRGAVFGVRAVRGAGGAVLGVTGERASSRWRWNHGRNDPWEVWKKVCMVPRSPWALGLCLNLWNSCTCLFASFHFLSTYAKKQHTYEIRLPKTHIASEMVTGNCQPTHLHIMVTPRMTGHICWFDNLYA